MAEVTEAPAAKELLKPQWTFSGSFPPDIFTNGIPLDLICCVCEHIPRIPVEARCGHFACDQCWKGIRANPGPDGPKCMICRADVSTGLKPSNYLRIKISALDVRCPCFSDEEPDNKEKSCSFRSSLGEHGLTLEKHLTNDCKVLFTQCIACNEMLRRCNLAKHLESECMERIVKCEHCARAMSFKSLVQSHSPGEEISDLSAQTLDSMIFKASFGVPDYVWSIDGVGGLVDDGITSVLSDVFQAEGYSWRLQFFPYGQRESKLIGVDTSPCVRIRQYGSTTSINSGVTISIKLIHPLKTALDVLFIDDQPFEETTHIWTGFAVRDSFDSLLKDYTRAGTMVFQIKIDVHHNRLSEKIQAVLNIGRPKQIIAGLDWSSAKRARPCEDTIYCPLGCDQILQAGNVRHHIYCCSLRWVTCDFCDEKIRMKDYVTHILSEPKSSDISRRHIKLLAIKAQESSYLKQKLETTTAAFVDMSNACKSMELDMKLASDQMEAKCSKMKDDFIGQRHELEEEYATTKRNLRELEDEFVKTKRELDQKTEHNNALQSSNDFIQRRLHNAEEKLTERGNNYEFLWKQYAQQTKELIELQNQHADYKRKFEATPQTIAADDKLAPPRKMIKLTRRT